MKRNTTIAGLLAAVIATTSIGTAPVYAKDNGDGFAKILTGAAVLALIVDGKKRHKDREAAEAASQNQAIHNTPTRNNNGWEKWHNQNKAHKHKHKPHHTRPHRHGNRPAHSHRRPHFDPHYKHHDDTQNRHTHGSRVHAH